jgi:hypothetical protein
MDLYPLDDSDLAHTCAAQLITGLRDCPIPELARLGSTLHTWRVELATHFDHPDVSNGPTENLNLKIKKRQAGRPRLPQLRPLPTATIAQPRTHTRRSLTDANQNRCSQVRCVEPDIAGTGGP